MAQQPTRSILKMIFTNFINSLRPRQISGDLIGTDRTGTKYYEIPANPSRGKRKPSRWFEPTNEDNFDQDIPPEWESWLRGRRIEPPTEEEISKNLEIMQLKKINAAALDTQFAKSDDQSLPKFKTGPRSFPQYKEYK